MRGFDWPVVKAPFWRDERTSTLTDHKTFYNLPVEAKFYPAWQTSGYVTLRKVELLHV
jgi:hypothetical protein